MLARLEEFETMLSFIEPDVKDSKDILKSIVDYKPEFEELCQKIDSTEFLIAHIKSNLDTLEAKIEEGEAKMGVDAASKVTEKMTNIFTPLFVSIVFVLVFKNNSFCVVVAEKINGKETDH